MQMPSYYQPPASPAPPYYKPSLPRESALKLAAGVLNVFFGYVYIVVTAYVLIGASVLRMGIGDILQVLGLGWAGIGLFIGGILYLRGSASGAGMIKSVAWVVLATLLFGMCAVITQVSERYHGAVIVTYLTQLFLFGFYPLIANYVAHKIESEY